MADDRGHSGAAASHDGRTMQCIIVTPEATALDARATFIALPLFDGEVGVAPAHSPFIGRLGYGELRIVEHGATRRFYIDGGFVQVADDVVSVLTAHATPAEQLSSTKAQEQLSAARSEPAHSEESLTARELKETQARAKLRVAEKAGR